MRTLDLPTHGARRTGNRRRATLLVAVGLAVLGSALGVASAATFVTTWGTVGSSHGQFRHPEDVAVAHGHVYVADTDNSRIQKFNAAGDFLKAWGSYGSGPGLFLYPYGVAVDANDHVYVADTRNNRIQKFIQP